MSRECKSGWLPAYITYTRPQQSPTLFHTWTAVSTIASVLGRKVWLEFDYYKVYPNLYVILVSDSGVGNKTTAIKIGTEGFLAKVPSVTIMRGALTSAYLVEWMLNAANKNPRKEAEVTIFCEEFKVFAKGLYANSGLIEDLTKVYDCGIWDYRTKGGSTVIVEKPCVNLLAASTPEWFTTGSAADFIGGGLSSRILPPSIIADEKQVALPKMPPDLRAMEPALLHDLLEMEKLQGRFLFTKGGEDFFQQWYDVRKKHENPDLRMRGYYSKKHTQVLKLAMILSVSMSDDLIVDETDIQLALQLLTKLEQNMPWAYQGVAWGEEAKMIDKVLATIRVAGEIEQKMLIRKFRLYGVDVKQVTQHLIDSDEVVCVDNRATGGTICYKYKGEKEKKEGEK